MPWGYLAVLLWKTTAAPSAQPPRTYDYMTHVWS